MRAKAWLRATLLVVGTALGPSAGHARVLYAFSGGADGGSPVGGLLALGGALYGTTAQGGVAGDGTVFVVDPLSGAENVLHQFSRASGDGAEPQAALVGEGHTLYGTTMLGGAHGLGTVFKVDTVTGAASILHSFAGGSDGTLPSAALVLADGALYGTAERGGAANAGIVFKVDAATGSQSVLYNFTAGADGGFPRAGLVKAGETLYGTADGGGTAGVGVVFALDLRSGVETVLHTFTGSVFGPRRDGALPVAPLLYTDGVLYGTTAAGGSSGVGTVFKIDPTNGHQTILHEFIVGTDGSTPEGDLIRRGGVLYGTTRFGGSVGFGTVFAIDPRTRALSVVHSFPRGGKGRGNYASPAAGVVYLGGALYGTKTGDGSAGAVFKVRP